MNDVRAEPNKGAVITAVAIRMAPEMALFIRLKRKEYNRNPISRHNIYRIFLRYNQQQQFNVSSGTSPVSTKSAPNIGEKFRYSKLWLKRS